jgi:hypothetical protein
MAKGRVGVLEAHEAPDSSAPQIHCGRAIAERLIASRRARRLGKRLIQMVRLKACEAIKEAKAARDAALAQIAAIERTRDFVAALFEGPLGIGNLIPFARLHPHGDKLHYEVPMAGDRGCFARHRPRNLRVSSRSLFSRQPIPAVRLAV